MDPPTSNTSRSPRTAWATSGSSATSSTSPIGSVVVLVGDLVVEAHVDEEVGVVVVKHLEEFAGPEPLERV